MSQNQSSLLTCITISKYFDSDFIATCHSLYSSLPSEFIKSIQLVAVISSCEHNDVTSFFDKHLTNLPFKLLIGADHSLYNAMNIGILNSTGQYLYFLNAGDFVCSTNLMSDFIYHISSLQYHKFCFSFSSIQQYKNLRWLRPSLSNNSLFFRKMLPPHQGIIVPNDSLTPFFNESLPLTADSDWIRKVVSIYRPLYSPAPIVIFSLGGLSNTPSLKLLSLRLKERNYIVLFYEIVKFIFFLFLPTRIYYRIIFLIRGLKFI